MLCSASLCISNDSLFPFRNIATVILLCCQLSHNFALFYFPSPYNVDRRVSVAPLNYVTSHVWIHFLLFLLYCFFVYMCLSVPSTRRPHNPASIHHSPPTSHPSRSYCSIRHPRLRPHSQWQQRYSTTPRVPPTPSACYCIFPFLSSSLCPITSYLAT